MPELKESRQSDLVRTCLLVDGEIHDPSSSTPGSNLGDLANELLDRVTFPAAALEGEDDADMLGYALDGADVVADIGRIVVVVSQDGGNLTRDGIVGDAKADVDGEDGVDEDVEDHVDLILEEAAETEMRLEVFLLGAFGKRDEGLVTLEFKRRHS